MYRYLVFLLFIISLLCCKKENNEQDDFPIIVLKTGNFTSDGEAIPLGGKISFGITAAEGSSALTNLRIQRIINGIIITELDKGMYITKGGLDFTFNSVKSAAEVEQWSFMVMNANKDSTIIYRTVILGEGTAYGPIHHFASIKIGMQHNDEFPHFLDLHTGNVYTSETVAGKESFIDLVGFVYYTGGVMSPTLCCPAYSGSSSVTGHYPEIGNWATRNSTLYDYYTADNNLIAGSLFDEAINDSLLVASYMPGNVSGLCKFSYTGKIIPFKTEDGKYGLVKIVYSDVVSTGYMDIEIKIQQ